MSKTFFLSFVGSASEVHKTSAVAGEAVKQRLLTASSHDKVVVTYCAGSMYEYKLCFDVTKTYIIVHAPPMTVYLDKAALETSACQTHLHQMVRAALEV